MPCPNPIACTICGEPISSAIEFGTPSGSFTWTWTCLAGHIGSEPEGALLPRPEPRGARGTDAGAVCAQDAPRAVAHRFVAFSLPEDASVDAYEATWQSAKAIAASCNVGVCLLPAGAKWQQMPVIGLARDALLHAEVRHNRCAECGAYRWQPEEEHDRPVDPHERGCTIDAALTAFGLDTAEIRARVRAATRPR